MDTVKILLSMMLIVMLLVRCETFPDNPSTLSEEKSQVFIEHFETEYVPATHPVVGVNANKTNVLFFHITTANLEAHCVEFLGRAMVESEDGLKEHAVHFRTDEVMVTPEGTDYTYNTLDTIKSGTTYTVIRSKFPTNDYAPFEGDIGKIQQIEITDVRVYNYDGQLINVDNITY